MIHHCDVINTPRRVTVIRAVPPAPHTRRSWTPLFVVLGALILVASAARAMGAQVAPAARPDSARPATRAINWTSDRRTFGVGDILQVRVDEYALAEANKSTTNSASRNRRMGVGVTPPTLPGGASPIGATDAAIETGDAGESRQRGNAARNTRYVGDLAVRVVAVTPDGLLRVQGSKVIDVDKNKTTLSIAGLVRPIDVGPRDIIRSESIADAQITYAAPGGLGKPKNGLIGRVLGLFWP